MNTRPAWIVWRNYCSSYEITRLAEHILTDSNLIAIEGHGEKPVISRFSEHDAEVRYIADHVKTFKASVFPHDIHLFDSPYPFVVAQHPHSGQSRISATVRVLNHAKNVFFIVSGKPKAEIVARILNKRKGYDKFPASKVMPGNNTLFWLLDQEAASLL